MVALAEAFVRIRPDLDGFTAEAKAKIERTPLKAHATIDLDSGAADAQIAVFEQQLRGVDGRTAHANVDVDVGAAMGKIALVAAALGGLSLAAAGIGGAVGLGAVAGAGIGAAVAGLSGIGGAVKALGENTKSAGAAAGQAAGQQLALAGAMDRVRSAQASLANTIASASDSARRAHEQEAAAQRGLTSAQQALTRAREDAVQHLKDLSQALKDVALQQESLARHQENFALQQRGAQLNIRQAQLDLNKVLADPRATQLQRDQARLAFDEAVQHNKDLTTQAKELAAQTEALAKRAKEAAAAKSAADRKGIAGSDQVVAAQERIADAQRAVKDAAAAAANQQRQAAFQIAQAQQGVVDAQRAVQAASISAGTAGAAATDKLKESMEDLSPAGRDFARFLRGFIDGPIRDLRMATQQGLLPGLQAGLATLGPIIKRNLPAIQEFSRVFGKALGGLIEIAGKLLAPFLKLGTSALKALAPLKDVLDKFADAFGKMVDQVTSNGSLRAAMNGVVLLFAALLGLLPQILPPMIDLAGQILPAFAEALTVLLPLLVNLAVAFGPLLIGALQAVTPLLAWLGNFVKEHPVMVRDLLVAVLALVGAVKLWTIAQGVLNGVLAANPIGLVVLAVAGLVAAFVIAWRHSERFRDIVVGVFAAVNHAKDNVVHAIENVGHAFGNVANVVSTAAGTIKRWWNDIVGFVGGLPRRLASAGARMWDWIKDSFRSVINWVIRAWNNIDWKVPSVSIGGHEIWTPTIGLPDIPPIPLAAGGVVRARPGGTMATVGEGGRDEAVVPLGSGGGLEDAVAAGVARALAGAELRIERRGAEAMARIVRAGELSLRGL